MTDKEKEILRKEKSRLYYKQNKERIKERNLASYYNKKYKNSSKKPSDTITVIYDDVKCEI
jgi:hypothetical protein